MSRVVNMSMAKQCVKLLRSFQSFQIGQGHALQKAPRLDTAGLLFRSLNYALFSTNQEVSSLDKTEEDSEIQASASDNSPVNEAQHSATDDLPPATASKAAAPPPTPPKKKDPINDRLLRMSGTMGPSEYDNQVHNSYKGRASSAKPEYDDEDGDRYQRNPNGYQGGFKGNNGRGGGGGRQWNY